MRRRLLDRFLVLVAIAAMMASQVAIAAHGCANRTAAMAGTNAVASMPCAKMHCSTNACAEHCRDAQAASDGPKSPEAAPRAAPFAWRLPVSDASGAAARKALERSQVRTYPPPAALLPVLRI